MRVCPIRDQSLSRLLQGFSDCACVRNDLLTVLLEGRSRNLLQLNGKGADLVVVGPTLQHWEDGEVDPLKQLFLAENHAGTRPTETLVRSGRHYVAILERVVHLLRGDQATDVSDVCHKVGTHAVSNLAIACVIEVSGVATCATEEYIWAKLGHSRLERVHVDDTSLFVDKVRLADKVMARRRYFLRFRLVSVR